MAVFQTLSEVVEAGTFKFKTYGEESGAYLDKMMHTGLTEAEKSLMLDWYGDRCIGSESPAKFQKYFDRLWSLYAWQYRNMAAAWFGTDAADFKARIIGEFNGESFNWNQNFLITVDTAINGITSSDQNSSSTSTTGATMGGTVSTTGSTTTTDQKGGADTTTTSGTSDSDSKTTNGGSDSTKTTGSTTGKSTDNSYYTGTNSYSDSTTTESTTKDTKLAGSTTKSRDINKNNPMSIVNSVTTDGSIPTLDWTYATGQSASESITTPDGKTDTTESTGLTKVSHDGEDSHNDHGEHTAEGTSENISTITHGTIVEGKGTTSTNGSATTTYGATDTATSESKSTQDTSTTTKSTSEAAGSSTGSGTSDTTTKGRNATLAALYGEYMSLLNASPAWAWMMGKIEPAFLAIYDI